MTDEDFDLSHRSTLAMYLNGSAIASRDTRGQRITDDSFILMLNGYHEPVEWTFPPDIGKRWNVVFDTSEALPEGTEIKATERIIVGKRSMVVLIEVDQD